MPRVSLHIIRNNSQIGRDARPYARGFGDGSQIVKIDGLFLQERSQINNVAEPQIKVPVHALQSRQDNAAFGCGHAEAMAVHFADHAARRQSASQFDVFPGLAQARHMHFHGLAQARDFEVPFVGEPIAPAALQYFSMKALGHREHHASIVGRSEQVQITSQVRPMFERLNDENLATG